MPVIKNILRKAKNSFQGLKNVDVFIEDTDPNSKYFNIFDLPEELPLGCSSFLIEGSELLKKEVNLKIELLDSQNNVVFTTPVDNYLEDKSRRVSIEVYEDVAAGVATLTILGELDPTKTSVPQGFRDVYNVRFNKRVNINKTKENDRPIRFYGPPTISVSEIVKGVIEETTGGTNQTSTVTGTIGLNVTTNKVLDSEIDIALPTNNVDDLGEKEFILSQTPKSKKTTTFNSKIGKKGKKKKKQKKFKTTYSITGNVVAMGAGTNNSTNKITSDFVGATITISNPHQLVDTEKFPTTRYSLPTTYSTTISEVVNETTFKVQTPYYVTDDTAKRIPVSLKSATNNASITYDAYVEETESTIFKRSYADITIGNLRTFSGDVYKAKIFTRDSNTPTDFEKIYDAFVEPPNILIDQTSATGFTNIGFFHQQSDINNNWVSSSIGGSEGALAEQNNQYLVDGLLLSGSVETLDNLVEFRTKNSFDLEKDVDYVVRFDSYFFKDTAEYKSDQDTISTESRADLKVFLSGSGLTGNAGEEDYYLGKVEIPTNSNDEGEISNVVGSFRSAGSGSPKAWLKFKLNSGRFIIKDVSIEPFSEENFNPNYFRTIVPMPGLVNVKRNRLFDFRAEFYDVNNNEADVGATIERVNFDGTPTIIQGEDNKLSGSLLVGESIEMYGTNPAYLRSVGYQGFAHTIANNKGGFLLFSGSIGSGASGGNRLTASEAYQGVGLEIVDAHSTPDRFIKFRTDPSEFTVQTDQFFFGKDGQFISGSNGNIVISSSNFFLGGESTFVSGSNDKLEISSSNFHLDNDGSVIMQGTITAEAGGTIGGFTIGSDNLTATNFVLNTTNKSLSLGSGNNIFIADADTGIQLGHATFGSAPFRVTPAGVLTATSATIQGAITATSGEIGGFTIDSDEIKSTNLLLDSNNEKITVGSANAVTIQGGGTDNFITMGKTTFGQTTTVGAILGMDATVPTLELFKDANNQFIFNNSGIDIKADTFDLDATTLIMDSTTNSGVIKLGASGGPGSATGTSNGGAYIDGTGKFNFVGDANNFIRFNSSGLEINTAKFDVNTSGEITATGGTIGGFTITSTELFSLDSGTPDSSPNNGITIDTTGGSNSKAVIRVFDGTTENAALGNFASNKFGIKAIEGDIGGFTIDSDEIKSTNLLLDSSNEKITLGSANSITLQSGGTDNFMVMGGKSTFGQTGTAGIIIGMDAAVPKLDLTKGTGNDNYLRFDGSNGLDIKTPSFKLDTDRLDIDSSTSRISVFDDAGSPKEVIRIGEVDGASNFGMKIFDGTGTADSDILVEFSETTNNIAGWVIGTSTIQGGNLVLNKEGTIESVDFSSGNIAGSGRGFRLSALDNGFLEVENARIRGTLSTAVFEKETVNAVGGQLLIGNSTTITGSGGLSGVTASSATMSVENVSGFTGSYNGFNAAGAVSNINNVDGEILIIKKVDNTGFSTEYVCVQSASFNDPDNTDTNPSGLLYVSRSFGLGTGTLGAGPGSNFTGSVGEGARNYEDGQVVVSTGRYISGTGDNTTGTGYINLNARPTDGFTPYIDMVERTGSKVYEMDLKARLGDLSGISTAKVGSSPGFGLFTDRAFLTQDVTVGTLSGEHVLISGSYLAFKNDNTIMAQLEGTTWTLGGQTGTTEDAIKIAPGGVFIYDNSNDYVKVTSDGLNVYESGNNVATFGANSTITGGTITLRNATNNNDKVVISENSFEVFDNNNTVASFGANTILEGGTVTIRNTTNNNDKVVLSENKLEVFDNNNVVAEFGANTVLEGGTVTIRNTTNNNDKVVLSENKLEIFDNNNVVAEFAANTVIEGGTITLRNTTNNNDKVVLSQDKLQVFDNNTDVASFGAVTRIGDVANEHISASSVGVTIKDGSKILANYSTTSKIFDGENNNSFVEVGNDGIIFVSGSITGSEFGHANGKFTASFFGAADKQERVEITDDGMEVYQGGVTKAIFGSDTTLTGGTLTIQGTAGTIGDDKIVVGGGSLAMFANASKLIDIVDGKINIGPAAVGGTAVTGNVRVEAGNVYLYGDNTNTFAQMSSAGLELTDDGTKRAVFAATTTIGDTATEHISISSTELKIKDGNGSGTDIDYVTINSSGMNIGNNISLGTNGNATFSGNVQIGSGESVFKADSNGIYLGNETFGSAEFRVTPAGAVTATNATLTGAVTATSGDIAGWTISGNDIIKTTGTNLKTIQLDSNTPKILIQSGSGGTANFNEIRMDASAGNIKVRQDGVQVFNTGDRIQPVTAQSFIVKSLPLSSTTLGSTVPVTTVTHLSASQQIGTNNLVVDEIFRMKALEANLASKTPFYVSITDPLSQTKAVGSNATPIFFEVSKSYDTMDPAHEIGQSAVFSTALTSNNDGGRFVGSSNTTGSAIYHFQTILTEASANHFDDAKFCVMRLDADVSGIATGQNDEFVFLEARSTRTPITRDTRVFQVQYDGDVLSAGNITAFGSSFMNVSDKGLKKEIHTISKS